MAWYDPTSWDPPGNWRSLRDNPITNVVMGDPARSQPGVAVGPAPDPSRLVNDPVTGMFYDPVTGNSYTDASGAQPVMNPNLAQQVATNAGRANAFLSQLQGMEAERGAVAAEQGQLADTFRDVISGAAPSVAEMQARGIGQAGAAQQLAQAAGASGASAPLAQLAAARNTGQVMIGANNAGVIARVAEQRAAMDALNNLLNSRNTSINTAAGRTADLGNVFAGYAQSGQGAEQGLRQDIEKKRAEEEGKFGAALLKMGGEGANPDSPKASASGGGKTV